MRGVPDAQVRWDLATHSPIRFDRLVFPRRQPEFDLGEIQTDLNDVSEVFEIP
jgi:hypothetical protein